MDKLATSGAGSVVFPLLLGAASVFAPRLGSGLASGLQMAEHFGEKAEKRKQTASLREMLLGGGGGTAPTAPATAQAQGAPPPAEGAPPTAQQDWQRRLQSVLPPEIVRTAPDPVLPHLLGAALTAMQRPEGKPYYDEKTGRFVVATPPGVGEPAHAWRVNEIAQGTPVYGQEYDQAAATFSQGQFPTYAALLKANPAAAQQLDQRMRARKAGVGTDYNEASLELFGKPYGDLIEQGDRAKAVQRWAELQRFKGVQIPVEREAGQTAVKYGMEATNKRPVMTYNPATQQIETQMVSRDTAVHIPSVIGGGTEPRAESVFIQKSLHTLGGFGSPTEEQLQQSKRDLEMRGFAVTERSKFSPSYYTQGRWEVLAPGQPAAAAPQPAPAQKSQKKEKTSGGGIPSNYQPPWASDYNKR